MHAGRWEQATCLGFESGVRDFRREAGAWNMDIGFTSNVQFVGFVRYHRKCGDKYNDLANKFWICFY